MAFHYSDEESFEEVLNNAHKAFINRFKRTNNKKEAQELEKILLEIKLTARSLSSKRDPVSQELYDQYLELINTATSIQNLNRKNKFSASGLFSRTHDTKTSIKAADDIFEEDLAAILAAGEVLNGSSSVNLETYLTGGKSASSRALNNFQKEIVEDTPIDLLNKMAKKAQYRYQASNLRVNTGKIDVKGYSINMEISKDLPFNIQRLMELMKDATFTAKNYKSFKQGEFVDINEIGLHLGNTNLYKAVTGALSEIGAGHKQQQSIFYRGAYTYLGNKHNLAQEVATHFGHMRMIYELRGSGLLDESGQHVTYAKYLIYNDPSSDAIYVRDTASLLYEMIDSNTSKLFGGISISAGKVKSN